MRGRRRAAARVTAVFALVSAGLVLLSGHTGAFPGASVRAMAWAPGPAVSPASVAWPTYMFGVERTGANLLEATIAPSNVSELRSVWTVSTNGSDFSSPIVVNGTVFFGSWNGYEYAVRAPNGSVEWTTFLGTDPNCNGGYTPMGISSTAAYLSGELYLGGGDGNWSAVNASTGHVDWSYLVGTGSNGFYDWASALVYRSSVYIGIASCFDSPLVPAGLLEVNLTAPHTPSHVFTSTPPGAVGESIWTTPAVDPSTNTLWIATGNENPPGYPLYANAIVGLNATTLNVTGSWQVPNVAGQDADFGSTPTLFTTPSGLPMIVATNKNGVAYALNRSNVSASGAWTPVWNLTTGGGFAGGAFDGHTLYLAGGSSVYAVDPSNGSVLWTAPMVGGGTVLGSLAWANGLVYADGGAYVEAIDASNGTVDWNASLPAGQSAVSEPVVADGRLYVASGDYGTQGYVTAFGIPFTSHAAVTPLNGTAPLRVAFTAQAHGGLPPYAYSWSFGDGGTATGAAPSHTYSTGGTYVVHAWINDSAGATGSSVWAVNVTGNPVPTWEWILLLGLIVPIAPIAVAVAIRRRRTRKGDPSSPHA